MQLAREDSVLAARRVLSQRGVPEGDDVALIRFQLPQGGKVSEKFHRDDKIGVSAVLLYCVCCVEECPPVGSLLTGVQILYAFLTVHFAESTSEVSRFVISTNFPKKDLTNEEATLQQEVQ